METEQEINKNNKEVKNIEEQYENIKKTGAVAAAVLSAFLNTAPVAAAGYTPPTEPKEAPELVVPKAGAEQPVTGDAVLRPGMTPAQIDAVAKEAVTRYEMEQDFKGILQECTNTAKETGNAEQGTQKCVEWYKQQEAKGFSSQALKVMQQSLEQERAKMEDGVRTPFFREDISSWEIAVHVAAIAGALGAIIGIIAIPFKLIDIAYPDPCKNAPDPKACRKRIEEGAREYNENLKKQGYRDVPWSEVLFGPGKSKSAIDDPKDLKD
ncbi:MAG: hypothetical protein WC878_07035 [Candidatus Paceibacterota bacterium]|jgi:hypothetical protein